MLMVLCFLQYTVAEWLFRKILKERNATVMNPRNKPTARPTMKRVFFLFRWIRQVLELVDFTVPCCLLNVNDENIRIIGMFGEGFKKYGSSPILGGIFLEFFPDQKSRKYVISLMTFYRRRRRYPLYCLTSQSGGGARPEG